MQIQSNFYLKNTDLKSHYIRNSNLKHGYSFAILTVKPPACYINESLRGKAEFKLNAYYFSAFSRRICMLASISSYGSIPLSLLYLFCLSKVVQNVCYNYFLGQEYISYQIASRISPYISEINSAGFYYASYGLHSKGKTDFQCLFFHIPAVFGPMYFHAPFSLPLPLFLPLPASPHVPQSSLEIHRSQ